MQKEKEKTKKKKYEKPKVVLTPLQIEERLMGLCGRNTGIGCADLTKS